MEEKKLTRIPLVIANEEGTAQLENLRCVATKNCSFEKYFSGAIGLACCLEQHITEGDNPVRGNAPALAMCFRRVGLFGNADQNGKESEWS